MKAMMALVALGLVSVAVDARAACEELQDEIADVRSLSPQRGEVIVEREQEWCIEDDAIGEAREVYSWYEVIDRNGKPFKWFVAGNEIQRSQFAMRMLKGEVPPEALHGEEDLEDFEKRRKFEETGSSDKSPTGKCSLKVDTSGSSITARVLVDGKPVWSDAPRTMAGKGKADTKSWWVPNANLLLVRYALPVPPKAKGDKRSAVHITTVGAYREQALAPCFDK